MTIASPMRNRLPPAPFHQPEGGKDGQPQSRLANRTLCRARNGRPDAGEQDERAHDQSGNHHHGERFRAGHIHILHEIGDHEHRKDVEEHAVDPARAHAERDIAGMLLTDAYDGQALVFGLAAFLRLAEVGGFKDMHTDIEGHAHQNHAEQKRAAPAPMP